VIGGLILLCSLLDSYMIAGYSSNLTYKHGNLAREHVLSLSSFFVNNELIIFPTCQSLHHWYGTITSYWTIQSSVLTTTCVIQWSCKCKRIAVLVSLFCCMLNDIPTTTEVVQLLHHLCRTRVCLFAFSRWCNYCTTLLDCSYAS
jgi:hypothetical protein